MLTACVRHMDKAVLAQRSYQPVLEMFTWFKVSAKGFTKWPANRVKRPFNFSAMQLARL